jgi:hypothetical protein
MFFGMNFFLKKQPLLHFKTHLKKTNLIFVNFL